MRAHAIASDLQGYRSYKDELKKGSRWQHLHGPSSQTWLTCGFTRQIPGSRRSIVGVGFFLSFR